MMRNSINTKPILYALMLVFAFGVMLFTSQTQAADLNNAVWEKQEFKIKGTVSLVEENGQKFIVLSDDFKTRSAPDLKLFFSPNSPDSVNGNNATQGSVLIAELEDNKGSQRYAVPAEVNISQFESLVLHCEKYSKLWGATSLK